MARVIICDLCANRVDENSLTELAIGSNNSELCEGCFTSLMSALKDDKSYVISQLTNPLQNNTESPTELTSTQPQNLTEIDIEGASYIKPTFDLSEGSDNVREINKKLIEGRGACQHHYKTYEDGEIKCTDAPPGAKGPYATFKGCGKTLRDNEL